MSEGGREAVRADDDVVPAAELRRLEERVRDLERLLGRKTMENEILKEALDLARAERRVQDLWWPAHEQARSFSY
jgi:transposase